MTAEAIAHDLAGNHPRNMARDEDSVSGWYRGWRIWKRIGPAHPILYAHPDADLEDEMDRRQGTAPSFQVALDEIDEFLDCEERCAAQRQRVQA